MKIYEILNQYLDVHISSLGAELMSIKDKNGKEYLFNGDPKFWNKRSPILFPFVGRSVNNEYIFENKKYPMSIHGFAKDKEFALVEKKVDEITFELCDDEETYKIYPFHFSLKIKYQLLDNKIKVIWKVLNKDNKMLYYSIGGHPGFLLPKDKKREDLFILFDKKPLFITKIIIENGFAVSNVNTLNLYHFNDDHTLRIADNLFENEAIVIENNQVHEISLCDENKKPYLTVTFPHPIVAIWSPNKSRCPFVCIEPLYGRGDEYNFNGDLKNKRAINKLASNKENIYEYVVTIHNIK